MPSGARDIVSPDVPPAIDRGCGKQQTPGFGFPGAGGVKRALHDRQEDSDC